MPWIKYKLKVIPPTNKKTGSLDITALRNRKGIDEIDPGGKEGYPEIAKSKIVEWREEGEDLLVSVNATAEEAAAAEGEVLTDEQAEQLKTDVFGIKKPESGVTP